MFVGAVNKQWVQNARRDDTVVKDCLKTGYLKCAQYLQSKLPLQNKTILALSSLDPIMRGHDLTATLLTDHGLYRTKPFWH